MSATEALRLARQHGVRINVSGTDIVLDADREPAPAVLEAIRRNKAEIVFELSRAVPKSAVEDWRTFYDERAAIAEMEGGQPRARAEAMAYENCIVRWLNRNPSPSEPDRCAWCDRSDFSGSAVVPFGADGYGHTWLHPECWTAWNRERRAEAARYLESIGISAPSGTAEAAKLPDDFGKIGGA